MDLLQKNIDISHLSGYKTQARTQYFFELSTLENAAYLEDIYTFADRHNMPVLCVGGGTNMLFAFDVFPGIILKNSLFGYTYDQEKRILNAGSAVNMTRIAQILKNTQETRWERFIGLPGTVGGAVYGNAGCFGLEIQHHFDHAKVWNREEKK